MAPPATPPCSSSPTLGRRIVPLDKPLFTIGRRSETDLRLPGADISRVHAEITVEDGVCTIRDRASRFGTFVNGERTSRARARARRSDPPGAIRRHRDHLRGGRRRAVGREERGVGGDRAAPDGGAARRAARARVGPRARRGAGARARLGDRRHRRRARVHHARQPRQAARVQAGARARPRHAAGPHLRDEPEDSRTGVRDRASR